MHIRTSERDAPVAAAAARGNAAQPDEPFERAPGALRARVAYAALMYAGTAAASLAAAGVWAMVTPAQPAALALLMVVNGGVLAHWLWRRAIGVLARYEDPFGAAAQADAPPPGTGARSAGSRSPPAGMQRGRRRARAAA